MVTVGFGLSSAGISLNPRLRSQKGDKENDLVEKDYSGENRNEQDGYATEAQPKVDGVVVKGKEE
jgi:hypothetical protein